MLSGILWNLNRGHLYLGQQAQYSQDLHIRVPCQEKWPLLIYCLGESPVVVSATRLGLRLHPLVCANNMKTVGIHVSGAYVSKALLGSETHKRDADLLHSSRKC